VARLIHVSVEHPGREAIGSAGDLVAVADAVRNAVLGLDDRPATGIAWDSVHNCVGLVARVSA
jgi:hypothetical protein